MLTRVKIQNCYSLVDVDVELKPFTLLLGPNGAGKSNFLNVLKNFVHHSDLKPHFNRQKQQQRCQAWNKNGKEYVVFRDVVWKVHEKVIPELQRVEIYRLEPRNAGVMEVLASNPSVSGSGESVVRVLDSLKTGDREDLFVTIEEKLKAYVPEIEKLSFRPGPEKKALQVREKNIQDPVPVSALSEGTQLIIMLLTILYQERPPSLICVEDIDRGLHPRLLEKVVRLCFELAGVDGRPQIIATTHNPYLVDLFKGHEDAVIMVEKVDGATVMTPLSKRLEALGDYEEAPLGELWYSGFVGGLPASAP